MAHQTKIRRTFLQSDAFGKTRSMIMKKLLSLIQLAHPRTWPLGIRTHRRIGYLFAKARSDSCYVASNKGKGFLKMIDLPQCFQFPLYKERKVFSFLAKLKIIKDFNHTRISRRCEYIQLTLPASTIPRKKLAETFNHHPKKSLKEESCIGWIDYFLNESCVICLLYIIGIF